MITKEIVITMLYSKYKIEYDFAKTIVDMLVERNIRLDELYHSINNLVDYRGFYEFYFKEI